MKRRLDVRLLKDGTTILVYPGMSLWAQFVYYIEEFNRGWDFPLQDNFKTIPGDRTHHSQ